MRRVLTALLSVVAAVPVARAVSANHGASRLTKLRAANIQLDLGKLVLLAANSSSEASSSQRSGAQLVSATLPSGEEVACLNCDSALFTAWAEGMAAVGVGASHASSQIAEDVAGGADVEAAGSKHPNAPGYARWAKANHVAGSFLQRAARDGDPGGAPSTSAATAGREPAPTPQSRPRLNVTITALHAGQLQALRPRLRSLWESRRLVLGWGADPLQQRMGFVDALVSLARNTPAFVPADCGRFGASAPACGYLLSDGMAPAASEGELRAALVQSFGPELLRRHEFDAAWNGTEQRAHVGALMLALKDGYRFYRQTCLSAGEGCDRRASSELLGRVACAPADDQPGAGCVYSELRRCQSSGGGGGGASACGASASAGFFEYSRFHGPLKLFNTRTTRQHVMGQCEEFSRAAYAMLSVLGYEARYVLDFTDHVWVEVRLPPTGRADGAKEDAGRQWVHADPSEGVVDSPLMYEAGWGKQLTMIFAMTPWSIEHVTPRYTADYKATQQRRGVSEEMLQEILRLASHQLKYELPVKGWGHGQPQGGKLSKDWSMEDLALWTHFEAA